MSGNIEAVLILGLKREGEQTMVKLSIIVDKQLHRLVPTSI